MSPSRPSDTVAAPTPYGCSLRHLRLQARQAFFGMSQSFDAFAPCGVQCGGRGTCFGRGCYKPCYKPGRPAPPPARTPMRGVSSSTSNTAASGAEDTDDTRGARRLPASPSADADFAAPSCRPFSRVGARLSCGGTSGGNSGGGGVASTSAGAMPPPPTPNQAPPSGRASRAAKLAAQSVLSQRSGSDSEGSDAEGEVNPTPTPNPTANPALNPALNPNPNPNPNQEAEDEGGLFAEAGHGSSGSSREAGFVQSHLGFPAAKR